MNIVFPQYIYAVYSYMSKRLGTSQSKQFGMILWTLHVLIVV